MDKATEQKISEWSAVYGIDAETMQEMHLEKTSLDVFWGNPGLITTVFHRNSQLLQQFLAALSVPTNNADRFALQLDFMLPTPDAYSALFEGLYHPIFTFEDRKDIGAGYWNAEGNEYRYFPLHSKYRKAKSAPLTYVQTVGRWEKGFQHLVREEMSQMLEKGYFVYQAFVGHCFGEPKIQKGKLVNHHVGVNSRTIVYCCSHMNYNPSGSIHEDEDPEDLKAFWDENTTKELESRIVELNAKFFRKEERMSAPAVLGVVDSDRLRFPELD